MKKITFLFLILFNMVFAQETIIIQDNLQGSTIGVKVGGTITSEGYQPGIGLNHILYDVPVQVVEGYVEFQVKGFSASLMQDPNGGAMPITDLSGCMMGEAAPNQFHTLIILSIIFSDGIFITDRH